MILATSRDHQYLQANTLASREQRATKASLEKGSATRSAGEASLDLDDYPPGNGNFSKWAL
jgi:hypothetical protein